MLNLFWDIRVIFQCDMSLCEGCCKLSIEIKAEKGVQRMCSEGCAMGLGEMLEKMMSQMFSYVKFG